MTSAFPFGNGETFLMGEVNTYSRSGIRVLICPLKQDGQFRELPENAGIVRVNKAGINYFKCSYLFIRFFLSELFRSGRFFYVLRRPIYLFSYFKSKYILASGMKDSGFFSDYDGIYVSYWLDETALVLAIAKKTGWINSYYSRAHGFDIYRNRRKENYLPFQFVNIKNAKCVFSVSSAGKQYLNNLFPVLKNIEISKLGTRFVKINPEAKGFNSFVIVSCSSIIPVKRVDRILSILKNMNRPVDWVHFGDGPDRGKIELAGKELPDFVNVQFKGHCKNEEVLDFLSNQHVDLFINTSESEGIPVSIMEALSFGIPVIAPDVGGVAEIVNDESGFLMKGDFDPVAWTDKINTVIDNPDSLAKLRESAYRFWQREFNADHNYLKFFSLITNEEEDA